MNKIQFFLKDVTSYILFVWLTCSDYGELKTTNQKTTKPERKDHPKNLIWNTVTSWSFQSAKLTSYAFWSKQT